jgi:hypothetical protein
METKLVRKGSNKKFEIKNCSRSGKPLSPSSDKKQSGRQRSRAELQPTEDTDGAIAVLKREERREKKLVKGEFLLRVYVHPIFKFEDTSGRSR